GKRPLSSMTPTMLENDEQLAILGTPGGSRIISMVLLGALEAMDGRPVQQWVSRPRFHHQYLPDHIQIEDAAFSPDQRRELEELGQIRRASCRTREAVSDLVAPCACDT